MEKAMTPDLAAINAALRLGDRFYPPSGAEVVAKHRLSVDARPRYRIIARFQGKRETIRNHVFVVALRWSISSECWVPMRHTRWLSLNDILEVVHVPDHAPSFRKWGRE